MLKEVLILCGHHAVVCKNQDEADQTIDKLDDYKNTVVIDITNIKNEVELIAEMAMSYAFMYNNKYPKFMFDREWENHIVNTNGEDWWYEN